MRNFTFPFFVLSVLPIFSACIGSGDEDAGTAVPLLPPAIAQSDVYLVRDDGNRQALFTATGDSETCVGFASRCRVIYSHRHRF